jgi:hypothetical protein
LVRSVRIVGSGALAAVLGASIAAGIATGDGPSTTPTAPPTTTTSTTTTAVTAPVAAPTTIDVPTTPPPATTTTATQTVPTVAVPATEPATAPTTTTRLPTKRRSCASGVIAGSDNARKRKLVICRPVHKRRKRQAPPQTGTATTTTAATTTATGGPTITAAPLLPIPTVAIAEFSIPPYLIPIYQTAAAQYGVPWQLLAAINWVETDFGRDTGVSPAGAVGFMQFLPSTWRLYGIDATGTGGANPDNPVDAIFSAARYLAAAGAATDLSGAIFAYNHAGWYVNAVLERMHVIQAIPDQLLTAIEGLADGDFPVAARASYAGGPRGPLARAARAGSESQVAISAARGSPVVAVSGGQISSAGTSPALGHYVVLTDANGNAYTYTHLGYLARTVVVPRAGVTLPAIKLPPAPKTRPLQAASAGRPEALRSATAPSITVAVDVPRLTAKPAFEQPADRPPMRFNWRFNLLAHNPREKATAASASAPAGAGRVLRLPAADAVHVPLRPGTGVVAGTVLGTVGSHTLDFSIKPGGSSFPITDPASVLNGWRELGAASPARPTIAAIAAPADGAATPAQALQMSKDELERVVLADPRIQIYACGRGDIEAGRIDRRVLAVVEFLAASGFGPTVTSLECGHTLMSESGIESEHATGDAVDIAQVDGTPILGHQGPGSITDRTIRLLLTLHGEMAPHQIISLETIPGASNVLALSSHYDHIHIGFWPTAGEVAGASGFAPVGSLQWGQIARRLGAISNPLVAPGSSGND